MRVIFSRTVRRHMRDNGLFSEGACWSLGASDMANSLVDHWRRHPECSREDFVESFCGTNSGCEVADVQAVWGRLQVPARLRAGRGTWNAVVSEHGWLRESDARCFTAGWGDFV